MDETARKELMDILDSWYVVTTPSAVPGLPPSYHCPECMAKQGISKIDQERLDHLPKCNFSRIAALLNVSPIQRFKAWETSEGRWKHQSRS
jgi:hypothetical protein